MEAVFQREIFRFFPVDSCQLPVLSGRKRAESIGKIRKISGRTTASTKSPELPGTGRFWAGLFDLGFNTPQCMWVRVKTDPGTEFRELSESGIGNDSQNSGIGRNFGIVRNWS